MEKETHVLVIFPHPDDEAFGVSGTVAFHTKNGTPVTYACLTLGEMGRNMGNPPFCNRETLPLIRKKELEQSAKALGITDLRMLGYRDKTLEFEDEEKVIQHIYSIIEEVKPSLIISFYPGYAVHPDHDATGKYVVKAVERIAKENRPKLHLVAFSKNCLDELGEPDVVHNVADYMDIKLASMRAHKSQTQFMLADVEKKLKVNDPAIIAWLQTERFWTYEIKE